MRDAWIATKGTTDAGELTFRPVDQETTEVKLELHHGSRRGSSQKTGAPLGPSRSGKG
jgi:hypothetical protein